MSPRCCGFKEKIQAAARAKISHQKIGSRKSSRIFEDRTLNIEIDFLSLLYASEKGNNSIY